MTDRELATAALPILPLPADAGAREVRCPHVLESASVI
jgi:hypothetical protein